MNATPDPQKNASMPNTHPIVGPAGPADFPIKVIRSPKRTRTMAARWVDGVLEIRIPATLSAQAEAEAIKDLRRRALKRSPYARAHRSDAELVARAHELNARYLENRATIGVIRWVTNQNKRWASCTTATAEIRVSHRLQLVPDYVLDAVLVHELVHTFIPNHSQEFYSWADRVAFAERARGYLEAYQRFGQS